MPLLHLGWLGEKPFQVDADLIATGRTCVLGTSGSGKSYAVGVICEELCKNQVPFVLIDIEGEYSGLKEKYEVVWVGEDQQCDLSWGGLDLEELARHAPDSVPLILDLSETDDPRGKVGVLLSGIYREVSKRRTPYLVILEEADRFAPQVGGRLQIFDEVARRGRKRGLGLMLCTQRPSLVDKNILSQCGNQLIGKLVIKNDLQAVAQFFPGRGLPKQLTTLTPGVFYALGGLSPVPTCVKIRVRETWHSGITPKLMDRVVKPSMEVLAKLRSLRVEKVHLGLSPLIAAGDVPLLVKREKSFVFFGEEEVVTGVLLIWRPLVELGVRIRTGLLKKRFETMFFVLDGVTGRCIELGDRLVFREGLKRFLGLKTQHMEVLRALSPDKDSSLIDVASRMRISEDMIRRPMKFLEEKRLVRSSKVGRIKIFRRLVDLPKIQLSETSLKLEGVRTSHARVDEIKVKEAEIRDVVKGLLEGSDVESFKPFFYPLYHAELALKRRSRVVWVDGRTGRKVEL